MSKIQIVIEISEEQYNRMKEKKMFGNVTVWKNAICNGTPLPKGQSIESIKHNEYCKGWHDAICKALDEKYSIHCEEGTFRVVQEETLIGLGMSMDEPDEPKEETI